MDECFNVTRLGYLDASLSPSTHPYQFLNLLHDTLLDTSPMEYWWDKMPSLNLTLTDELRIAPTGFDHSTITGERDRTGPVTDVSSAVSFASRLVFRWPEYWLTQQRVQPSSIASVPPGDPLSSPVEIRTPRRSSPPSPEPGITVMSTDHLTTEGRARRDPDASQIRVRRPYEQRSDGYERINAHGGVARQAEIIH
jgi:hypothetical protein